MDFREDFVEIILNRKKYGTIRLINDSNCDFALKNVKIGDYVIATTNEFKYNFAILYIFNIKVIKFNEINDEMAQIENMKNGKELQNVLKQIYCHENLGSENNNNVNLHMFYFTCVHYLQSFQFVKSDESIIAHKN